MLGPILFICYINDMPDSIASFIYMYADDAKLFTTSRDQAMLQKDLDMLGGHEYGSSDLMYTSVRSCRWANRLNGSHM